MAGRIVHKGHYILFLFFKRTATTTLILINESHNRRCIILCTIFDGPGSGTLLNVHRKYKYFSGFKNPWKIVHWAISCGCETKTITERINGCIAKHFPRVLFSFFLINTNSRANTNTNYVQRTNRCRPSFARGSWFVPCHWKMKQENRPGGIYRSHHGFRQGSYSNTSLTFNISLPLKVTKGSWKI